WVSSLRYNCDHLSEQALKRSRGGWGTGASFLAPLRCGWGKGLVINRQPEWVFQAPCNLLVNVTLVQQEDGQGTRPVVMGRAGVEARARKGASHPKRARG